MRLFSRSRKTPPMPSPFHSLVNLLNESAAAIEQTCTSKNMELPSMEKPFSPQAEGPLMDPDIAAAATQLIAAASQLISMVRPAPMTLLTTAMQFHISSALRFAVESNVVEILRDAGPQGLHVKDICAKNNTDPRNMGRILRILATENIFREVSPDVFANNRISSASDTGKELEALSGSHPNKYEGTSGIAAAVCHFTDDIFKSSAYLTEALTDPTFSKSDDSSHTAFNLAFKTKLPVFAWFDQPGNEARLKRFGIAFASGAKMFPPKAILDGYEWNSLAKGSVVVDVGGGIGTQSMVISEDFPDLKIVVQDREAVVAEGVKHFKDHAPEALSEGRVTFQGHDFFSPQPVKNARVYFLRMILHDWPDSACIQILKHLRQAAGPHSELIIVEVLMDYACPVDKVTNDVPGVVGSVAPAPLLPNFGHGRVFDYLVDVQMMAVTKGGERTPAQYAGLLEKSGWKMIKISRAPIGHQKVIARVA